MVKKLLATHYVTHVTNGDADVTQVLRYNRHTNMDVLCTFSIRFSKNKTRSSR